MVKKTISFIVILLIFCTTGVALLIGTSNFGFGFGGIAEKAVSSLLTSSFLSSRWTCRDL